MNQSTFFFQAANLLVPSDTPDSQIDKGLPFEFLKQFSCSDELDKADSFEIPAINEPASDQAINAVSIPEDAPLADGWKSIPVRRLLSMGFSSRDTAKIIRACHIVQWRRESRFCGTCGSRNDDVRGQAQRICPKCGRMEFPRICPAVIVLITDSDNRILLAHNRHFKTNLYSHISGFNEAGETLEETVAREVREEINIKVKNIEYVKSQPWPFPNSLMLGFKASYSSGEIQPDGQEIEDAKWFTPDSLPELPGEGSLSRELINNWLKESA